MMTRKALFCLFLTLTFVASFGCATCAAGITIEKVLSGDEIKLTDGRILHLRGIETPPTDAKVRFEAAKQEVEQLLLGKDLIIEHAVIDRYGRLSADVAVIADGHQIWLQDELLRDGLAFVYPPLGNEPRLTDMLQREEEARLAKQGIWADASYADIKPENVDRSCGEFAFVTGTVRRVVSSEDTTTLFFDAGKKPNFVVIIDQPKSSSEKARANIPDYKNKPVRMRGWVTCDQAPQIIVTAPAQINVVGKPDPAPFVANASEQKALALKTSATKSVKASKKITVPSVEVFPQ